MNEFRRECYRSRSLIWLSSVSLCIGAFTMYSILKSEPIINLMMVIGAVLSLAWAIWSSTLPDQDD